MEKILYYLGFDFWKLIPSIDYKIDFFEDKDVYFSIQKIPLGLNLVEKMIFLRSITQNFNGFILKKYQVNNEFVIVYSKRHPRSSTFLVLMLEKLEIIKKMLKLRVESEIWIIENFGYECIGILGGKPIFTKRFDDLHSLNRNINNLVDNIQEYSKLDGFRVFGFDANQLESNKFRINEYSKEFVEVNITKSDLSINSFCKEKIIIDRRCWVINVIKICFLIILNFASLFLKVDHILINKKIDLLKEKIQHNLNDFPTKDHFEAMQKIENN